MSEISMGVHFGRTGVGRGIPADLHETGHAVARPETIRPPPVEQLRGTRLVYDREMKRSYVEFLDYASGRVLDRFPSERSSADNSAINSNRLDMLV